jgi:hypothetical protein
MTGIRRCPKTWFLIPVALSCEAACTMPPSGGVSGTVVDTSGKPMAGLELTLTSTPRVLGLTVPFADPARVPITTDEVGHFGVLWSHGDRHEGPLLEVSLQGYSPVAERLPLGTVECRIVLVAAGATEARSKASCRLVRRSE